MIFGTLLGDGCLYVDRKVYAIDICHKVQQLDYLVWKARQIGCKHEPKKRTSGYGTDMRYVRYHNKDLLGWVAGICLNAAGVKTVSAAWLDQLDDVSLAMWYQDDGSWGRDGRRAKNGDRSERYSVFNTCGFDSKSVGLLAEWLVGRGYAAKTDLSKGKYRIIRLNHSATIKLWDAVAPWTVLRHKIDLRPKPGVGTCSCGAVIEPRMRICHKCVLTRALESGTHKHRAQLITRFGTSQADRLVHMIVDNPVVRTHWVDVCRVGTEL